MKYINYWTVSITMLIVWIVVSSQLNKFLMWLVLSPNPSNLASTIYSIAWFGICILVGFKIAELSIKITNKVKDRIW